jgi:hypothetical protein
MERLAQAVAERVVNLVVEAIDVDALVQRVDVNALVQRVDVDQVIERVDLDAVLRKVDMNAVVSRVDINSIVDQLDIDALVEHTELGALIARSTTGVLTEVLDLLRSQGVGLDDFIARWTNRVLRRDPATLPLGPARLVPEEASRQASTPAPATPDAAVR